MLFATVSICNRLPQAVPHGAASYFEIHGEEAHTTGLQAIEARSFVHVEIPMTKMQ